MDTQDSSKVTRRRFIGTSAFAAGIIGSQLMTSASAQPDPGDDDPPKPLVVYPWDVEVDPPSTATLFLVQQRRLSVILNRSLQSTFAHMKDRAISVQDNVGHPLQTAINYRNPNPADPYTVRDDLVPALENARANCAAGISYGKFASLPHENDAWIALAPYLLRLQEMICVPILHTYPNYIEGFLSTDRIADIDWHGHFQDGGYPGRELEDLFVRPSSAINHSKRKNPGSQTELRLWRDVRNSGLLWCTPRVRVPVAELRILHAGDPDRARPNVPNDRKCINGVCKSNYPGEYCQQVEGGCNGMSEP